MSEVRVEDDLLAAGAAALERGAWSEARDCFERALTTSATGPVAHEGLSWATWWLEDATACLDAREAAYRGYRRVGDRRAAAWMALWLSDDLVEFHGAPAVAEGWLQRAARILEELEECPEHGWLAVFEAHAALGEHDLDRARRLAGEAQRIGRRQGVVDLEMFALATAGVALLGQGEVAVGLRHLGQATTAALSGDYEHLAPAAWSCCLMMAACEQVRDVDRGAQWCERIAAFSRRLDARFVTGVCRAHYGVIQTWRGDLDAAERELTGALDDLSARRPSWRREGVVRLGHLRRRQGRLEDAVALFEQAPDHPLALLGTAAVHLDRGEPRTARDLLERVLRRAGTTEVARADALELLVRAHAELDDPAGGARALEELRQVATTVTTGPLRAAVLVGDGLLAALRGDLEEACDRFEDAIDLHLRGQAPIEAAHVRVDLATTLAALERDEAAAREARRALDDLGALAATPVGDRARTLLERVEADAAGPQEADVLTARQRQVLQLVAAGHGDQAIAERLVVSPHTVHRHVANIFTRLGCSSRAAAVAEATRRGLLS